MYIQPLDPMLRLDIKEHKAIMKVAMINFRAGFKFETLKASLIAELEKITQKNGSCAFTGHEEKIATNWIADENRVRALWHTLY